MSSTGPSPDPTAARETLDDVVRGFRALRTARGEPSFGELALRITHNRIDDGMAPAAAQTARSTVYDAFRLGRTRVDAELVGRIALSLEESEESAADWSMRARRAVPAARRGQAPAEVAAPAPDAQAQPVGAPDARQPSSESPAEPAPSGPPRDAALERMRWLQGARLSARVRWAILAACVALNILGFEMVAYVPMVLYFDMIGTAIAALALGPWAGVGVAVATHLGFVAINPHANLLFLPVSIAGALVWGFCGRLRRFTSELPQFLLLNLLAAFVCTCVSVTLQVVAMGGMGGHMTDTMSRALISYGLPMPLSAFTANLFTSVADKIVAGSLALVAMDQLGRRLRTDRTTTTSDSGSDEGSPAPAVSQ